MTGERRIRSMQEWQPRDLDIECPHCGRAQTLSPEYVSPPEAKFAQFTEAIQLVRCRSAGCRRLIVILQRLRVEDLGSFPVMYGSDELIWPKHRGIPSSLAALPAELDRDAREAFATADISPRASAALSRRVVQSFIRGVLGVEKRDLAKEIQAVIDDRLLPPKLAEDLDYVRVVGNFAAHPIKVEDTGALVDVEPGETEWLLSVVTGLAEWYAGEKRRDAARDEMNEKLRSAGKPELKSASPPEASGPDATSSES